MPRQLSPTVVGAIMSLFLERGCCWAPALHLLSLEFVMFPGHWKGAGLGRGGGHSPRGNGEIFPDQGGSFVAGGVFRGVDSRGKEVSRRAIPFPSLDAPAPESFVECATVRRSWRHAFPKGGRRCNGRERRSMPIVSTCIFGRW